MYLEFEYRNFHWVLCAFLYQSRLLAKTRWLCLVHAEVGSLVENWNDVIESLCVYDRLM